MVSETAKFAVFIGRSSTFVFFYYAINPFGGNAVALDVFKLLRIVLITR